MAFLNKAESLELAKRLGIENADELPWPELQKEISARQKEEMKEPEEEPDQYLKTIVDPGPAMKEPEPKREDKPVEEPKPRDPMADYYGKQVIMAPELPPERYRLLKYDEVLGNDIELEERQFDMDKSDRVFDKSGGEVDYNNRIDTYHDYTTGTYRLKGRSDRKVVAMSSVPKENYGLGITAGVDWVPVVTWNGRVGYLWTHPTYPNVKALLMECGYYHEYKDLFKREPNIWYVAGKTLACDIGLVNHIFAEIEEKEKKRLEEENAYRRNLGL